MSNRRALGKLLLTATLLAAVVDGALFDGAAGSARAGELAEEIDRAIAARAGGPVAGPASDEEFVRRAYLDLAGRIPSVGEARAFFEEGGANKREELLARLLEGPEFPRRMQEAMTVMLLERREGKIVANEEWNRYLREAFEANKPWDAVVRELFESDGDVEATRPAIRFLVDGNRADAHQLTQDVARLFLGVDWKCAQCHNHPSIPDYKQADYFGLHAFLSQVKSGADKQQRQFVVDGPLKGPLEFASVFAPEEKQSTWPRLLGGTERASPTFAAGEEFSRPPRDGLPGVPKFLPRKLLATELTAANRRQFARNAANRFWGLVMGRGLVHPYELHHTENPPSHPELLERLTAELAARRYDVRSFLGELVRSRTYQRSSRLPEGVAEQDAPPASYRSAVLKPLSAEQLARSLDRATGQGLALDDEAKGGVPLVFKDYANGRTPLPTTWRDVTIVFANVFGHPAGEPETDFRPGVDQALFLLNDRLIADWLQPRPGSLVERVLGMESAEASVDEIYLSLLTRKPTAGERAAGIKLLDGESKREGVEDLCLGLLGSAEFRFAP